MLKDLNDGISGENRVIELFNKHLISCEQNNQKSTKDKAKYDLFCNVLCPSSNFKVEVKNDLYAKKSGNIAIEVKNTRQNKESGLYCTEADIWAHLFNDGVYFSSVKDLIKFTKTINPFKVIENAGDGNAKILLYKIIDIENKIMFRVDMLDKTEFYDILCKLLHT